MFLPPLQYIFLILLTWVKKNRGLNIQVLNLPKSAYKSLIDNTPKVELDFDDMYQYSIAKHYNLEIVTLDTDFKNVADLKVIFL